MNEIFIIKPQRDDIWAIGYYSKMPSNLIVFHVITTAYNKSNAINRCKNLDKIKYFYKEGNIKDIDFCSYCLYKLISDKLSEKYGNYCPNLRCNYLK